MDFNIDVRKKQLQSLDQYITSSKDKVQSILEYLGWNSKKILERETKTTCSVNTSHHIPLSRANKHIEKCYFSTLGYQTGENLLSEPLHDSTSSIKLDNAKKVEILNQARCSNQKFKPAWNGQDCDPMTSDRLFSTFSPDERLSLYDYCIKNTEGPPVPSEFNVNIDDKQDEKSLTEEQKLAKQRDAKRRRAKYKSVHTGRNKNHTEVMREVIDNQMEMYKEYLTKIKNNETSTCPQSVEENETQNANYRCNEQLGSETAQQDVQIECKEKVENDRPHSSVSHHSGHSGSFKGRRDHEYHRGDDYTRNEGYTRGHVRRDHSPHVEKRRKYSDKESREYSRDRKSRHYKSNDRY